MWPEQDAGELLVSMLTALDGGDARTYATLLPEALTEPGIAFPVVDLLVKLHRDSLRAAAEECETNVDEAPRAPRLSDDRRAVRALAHGGNDGDAPQPALRSTSRSAATL